MFRVYTWEKMQKLKFWHPLLLARDLLLVGYPPAFLLWRGCDRIAVVLRASRRSQSQSRGAADVCGRFLITTEGGGGERGRNFNAGKTCIRGLSPEPVKSSFLKRANGKGLSY